MKALPEVLPILWCDQPEAVYDPAEFTHYSLHAVPTKPNPAPTP